MKRAGLTIIVVGALLAITAPAGATLVTLLDTADNGIAAASATGNSGKYGFANADNLSSNGTRRFLAQWDLSSIPAGAVITSAQMNVYRYSSTDATDGKLFSVYRMTTAWTEGHGMSNGSYPVGVTPDGSTWTQAAKETSTLWTTAGGDFDVASRVQFTGATVMDPINAANFGWQPNVTAIVQAWVNGTANDGLIVCSDETSYQRHAMRTRDYGYPDNGLDRPTPSVFAPQLVIDYTVPEPMTMSLLALGGLGLLAKKRR